MTPWIGTYGDYQELAGVRVPTRSEVRWELPEGPFTYWRGTVTSLRLRPRALLPIDQGDLNRTTPAQP